MDLFIYIALLILSFLGLIMGLILSHIAVEELPDVIKYIKYFNILIVSLIVFLTIYPLSTVYATISSVLLLVLLFFFIDKIHNYIIYASMGGIFYASSILNNLFVITTLLFILGISLGTTTSYSYYNTKKYKHTENIKFKDYINITKILLTKYSYYLIVGIIFFIVFEFLV